MDYFRKLKLKTYSKGQNVMCFHRILSKLLRESRKGELILCGSISVLFIEIALSELVLMGGKSLQEAKCSWRS